MARNVEGWIQKGNPTLAFRLPQVAAVFYPNDSEMAANFLRVMEAAVVEGQLHPSPNGGVFLSDLVAWPDCPPVPSDSPLSIWLPAPKVKSFWETTHADSQKSVPPPAQEKEVEFDSSEQLKRLAADMVAGQKKYEMESAQAFAEMDDAEKAVFALSRTMHGQGQLRRMERDAESWQLFDAVWAERKRRKQAREPALQVDAKLPAESEEAKSATSGESGWIQDARNIALELLEKNPNFRKLNLEQIGAKVRVEMINQGIVGRGGRIPDSQTIKRHALKGIKD